MMEYHPGAAESHHCPDSLTHIRTVAVHRTLVTFGFGISELASVQSGNGVVKQFPALTAQLRAAVVLPAPQLNHMPNRFLFPIYASHILCNWNHFNMLKNPVHLTHIIEWQVNQPKWFVFWGGSMQLLDEEFPASSNTAPPCNACQVPA